MKKIKFNHYLMFLFSIFLIGWFYWYELRPIQTRKECFKIAFDRVTKDSGDRDDLNYFYNRCFREKGLRDNF